MSQNHVKHNFKTVSIYIYIHKYIWSLNLQFLLYIRILYSLWGRLKCSIHDGFVSRPEIFVQLSFIMLPSSSMSIAFDAKVVESSFCGALDWLTACLRATLRPANSTHSPDDVKEYFIWIYRSHRKVPLILLVKYSFTSKRITDSSKSNIYLEKNVSPIP